ncbi:unnamed protein product [Rhizophagus irregularis]|nr:unnamed protein product [Rhizophagus irregularis]
MDDSTLIAFSLEGLESLLSIARDFYFLNNITANFQKYELVSFASGNTLVTFNLTSKISNYLPPMSFSHLFGFWAYVRFKKLSSSQLAYLHSSVIIPKVQFRSQVLYLSEPQIMRIASGYYSLQRKALSLICRFLAWISLVSTGSKYSNWVLITLRTLQCTLKWPSLLDSMVDFSLWTSKRRSTSHNWLFQTIKLIRSIGLQFDFPDNTFLELMPNESCPLVSISPLLANLETHSWLKSALWCLS